MSPHIRRADADDLERAADVLAAAFDTYAWTRWTIPADDYPRRLRQLQRLYLGYAHAEGIVLVDDDRTAVIALVSPTASDPSEDMLQRVAELHGDRWNAVTDVALPSRPQDAWNLAGLGVLPHARQAGLGRALIDAGLVAVGGPAVPVTLETSDERNVRLYQRAGFAVTATTEIPGGPVVHSMLRSGRAGR
ncbi:GNAT family N-acetyltransferase [Mycobacterium sp. pV006]|uniref:GNAT family N-acetyltransferase n=1 Tax=Mycobacterium sp. pV006 TaxID=3238983 RepID=UPI00351B44FA